MTGNEELEAIFYVDKSTVHGRGLYARVDIAKGAYLGTYDGPKVEKNGAHVLWVEDDDGKWRGRNGKNMLRYLNHSNKPHAEFDGFDLYALRKITTGVEVTINYGDEY
jgi:hypothetical protein